MIRIKMLLLLFILLGCINKKIPNEYIFPESATDWYVIVNGCKNGNDFIDGNKRRFFFPENGILFANIDDFEFTKNDAFIIGQKSFDPNSIDKNSYKLCYHMISMNSGYNNENFDLYFFKIGKNCDNENDVRLDVFYDSLIYKLKSNKVLSVK